MLENETQSTVDTAIIANAIDPNTAPTALLSPEEATVEAPAVPGTSYHERLAAVEKHLANLFTVLGHDASHFEETLLGFGSHLKTLIGAGIHRAEDFVGSIFHNQVTDNSSSAVVTAEAAATSQENAVVDASAPVEATATAQAQPSDVPPVSSTETTPVQETTTASAAVTETPVTNESVVAEPAVSLVTDDTTTTPPTSGDPQVAVSSGTMPTA